MKFDRRKNPVACVAKEASRYAVQGAAVVKHGDKHYIAATDGRCLSMVACDLEGDEPKSSYPAAAFVAARKVKGPFALELNGSAKLRTMEGTTTEFQALESRFPDVLGVVPKTNQNDPSICLSVDLLRQLSDAFGFHAVRLTFQRDPKGNLDASMPVRVDPLRAEDLAKHPTAKDRAKFPDDDGSFGVVMPIACD